MPSDSKTILLKAHGALILVGVIYGLNYSVAKLVMNGGFIPPAGFIFFRALFGVLFFSLLLGSSMFNFPFSKSEWLRLAICGALGVAANQLCFFKGLALTTPINASLILTLVPAIVLLLSFVFLRDSIKMHKLLGLIFGGLGAILLITQGFTVSGLTAINPGDLLVFINVVAYAFYLVVVPPLLQKYDALVVVRIVFMFGFIYIIPFGWQEAVTVNWAIFTPEIWWAFAFVLVCTTGLTYWLNAVALKTISPPVVSIYIYLQPLVAAVAGVYFGQHDLNVVHLLSGLLIFAGILMMSVKKLFNR